MRLVYLYMLLRFVTFYLNMFIFVQNVLTIFWQIIKCSRFFDDNKSHNIITMQHDDVIQFFFIFRWGRIAIYSFMVTGSLEMPLGLRYLALFSFVFFNVVHLSKLLNISPACYLSFSPDDRYRQILDSLYISLLLLSNDHLQKKSHYWLIPSYLITY